MKNIIRRPQPNEYGDFYQGYINKIKTDQFYEALTEGKRTAIEILKNISKEKWDYKYAPDKWTIKELIQHIIDGERVFAYRALCIARRDKTAFPGFDQDTYADVSHANLRKPASLLAEYKSVRNATLHLYKSFTEEDLNQIGTASGYPVSPLALAFIIAGHEKHHMDILKERYL